MNYVLFNKLANNGEGEKRADALLTSLGVTEGDEYKKIGLVGLDMKEFVGTVTADDIIYFVGGDGSLNRLANDLDGVDVPCPVYLISGGTGNDFMKDIVENYPSEGYTDIRDYIKNLPTIRGAESAGKEKNRLYRAYHPSSSFQIQMPYRNRND